MLFNSFGYLLLFLPLVVIATTVARRYAGAVAAQVCILLASIVFYGWNRPQNLLYLAASVGVNWALAQRMAKAPQPEKKRWLQAGLLLNIVYLCVFKYVNFVVSSLPFLHGAQRLIPDLELPLGISFFTLMQVMYLVDAYEGAVKAGSLFDHATFVSFFPYVLSGPLAKAKRMRHQFPHFAGEDGKRSARIARGIYLFSLGLFKKSVCAQAFGQVATYGYESARNRSALEAGVFTVAYAMQLYFDFSGYTDMAIGTAEMLGVEIPRNFDAPFRSKSIIEFWQRWHISLSSFITTYLYTPLLRSFRRASLPAAMLSTFIAMAIAGLWHGPSWTFVLFGVAHGVALATNSWWRKRSSLKLPAWLSWLATFVFVDLAFIFFRSPTVPVAASMFRDLFLPRSIAGITNLTQMHGALSLPIFGPPLLIGLVIAFAGKSSEQLAREFEPKWSNALVSWLALTVSAVYMNSEIAASFIYFKF